MIDRHDARLHASIMMRSSMRLSLTFGGHVGWTRKTSQPRMDSLICTYTSPSANFLIVDVPSSMPR